MKLRALFAFFLVVPMLLPVAVFADESDELFSLGTAAIQEGRPNDAVANFEALADRGVVDAAVSFNRGLAYAARVRVGKERPGDLGQAAAGFEEARELYGDSALSHEAEQALTVIRSEVARRRSKSGDPLEMDQGASLGRAIVRLLPEKVWANATIAMSLLLGASLFVRHRATARRVRIAAAIALGVAAPLGVLLAGITAVARYERWHLREGVIVSANARPSDTRGVSILNASPLPEGARVEMFEAKPGWVHIRWGALDTWLPQTAVRELSAGRETR